MVLFGDDLGRLITDAAGHPIAVVGILLPAPTPQVTPAGGVGGLLRLGASEGAVRAA